MFKTDGKYETRNGSMTARFLCEIRSRKGEVQTVFLVKDATTGDEGITKRTVSGCHPDGKKPQWDIVPVVEKTSVFITVYKRSAGVGNSGTLGEAQAAGRSFKAVPSAFVGVLENKFEDGVYVRSVFHKEG